MSIKYYKLLDLLNRKGIGKTELRKKIDISSATLAKISKHEYVSLEVIDKICKVLECQPGTFWNISLMRENEANTSLVDNFHFLSISPIFILTCFL